MSKNTPGAGIAFGGALHTILSVFGQQLADSGHVNDPEFQPPPPTQTSPGQTGRQSRYRVKSAQDSGVWMSKNAPGVGTAFGGTSQPTLRVLGKQLVANGNVGDAPNHAVALQVGSAEHASAQSVAVATMTAAPGTSTAVTGPPTSSSVRSTSGAEM